jgi:hypothetical protein
VTGWLTFGGSGARPGATAAAVGPLRSSWFAPLTGTVTAQPLVAHNVPRQGDTTLYVATQAGFVYALAANGYVRWRVDLGRLTLPSCPQVPDGWGVTGTPVIDPDTRALYVADAFGRLHALDLSTGAERTGWPVVLYGDYKRELVWGALLLEGGAVYAGTGAYCDLPMEGKLIRVSLAGRDVKTWTTVPASLGGGGGIWGWGGAAYSAASDRIYVVTGNAFEGGSNTGADFSEAAGYGEHLVELTRDLDVTASDSPGLTGFSDIDFVGSPVVADTSDCGELVAAQAKNGMFFAWNAADVAAGAAWSLKLQKADRGTPLLTQPTWSARFRSFYVATASQLVRIELDAFCRPRIAWQTSLGDATLYPSPTVAGSTVWLGLPVKDLSGVAEALLGVDARSGRVLVRRPIQGVSFAPPASAGGALFLASMHGLGAGGFPAARGRAASPLGRYRSRIDAAHRWESREDGVYSTDDGGRHWRRIYPRYATRVLRLSRTSGLISVGSPAPACGCATRQLWTHDGGKTWRPAAIGPSFVGNRDAVYWWNGDSLFRAAPDLRRSTRLAGVGAAIVSGTIDGDGMVALLDRPGKSPQVVVVDGADARIVTLPPGPMNAVVRTIGASGSDLVVRGTYVPMSAAGAVRIDWSSQDGGKTWTFTPVQSTGESRGS